MLRSKQGEAAMQFLREVGYCFIIDDKYRQIIKMYI